MAKLVLVRHGESEWNAKGLWTGWSDVNLSDNGREEAKKAGEAVKDIHFDHVFISALKRAQQTWDGIKEVINQADLPASVDKALNERDYGDFTGKNKWEVKEQVGEEEFQKLRRSWDYPPANGESLKMVYERVIPYYEQNILPLLKENKNIIVVAHGNSLRALIKYLEKISDEEIPNLEMGTGGIFVYEIDPQGQVTSKEVRGSGDVH